MLIPQNFLCFDLKAQAILSGWHRSPHQFVAWVENRSFKGLNFAGNSLRLPMVLQLGMFGLNRV
jgi:hypothetical protein